MSQRTAFFNHSREIVFVFQRSARGNFFHIPSRKSVRASDPEEIPNIPFAMILCPSRSIVAAIIPNSPGASDRHLCMRDTDGAVREQFSDFPNFLVRGFFFLITRSDMNNKHGKINLLPIRHIFVFARVDTSSRETSKAPQT